MNAKLYKTEKENYVLVDPTKGTYDDGYMLGTSRESQYNKLSIKNCQAIECGYDLDELTNRAFDNMGYHSTVTPYEEKQFKLGYRVAFRESIELLGDKKFSGGQLLNAMDLVWQWMNGEDYGCKTLTEVQDKHIQSLQQKEWDVEVEKENVMHDYNGNISLGAKFKLDADGCLILKRID